MNVTYDFSGKVALVTGGGSGIGRASAEAFAQAGATVVVADIAEKNGIATVDAIKKKGGKAQYLNVDVGSEESVKALHAAIIGHHGKLDFAHNNAGIEGNTVPLVEHNTENWRRVLDVNLSSVFYCMQAQIPLMVGRNGAIVNTASIAGLIGGYNLSTYTSVKHAVVGLTKAAAMDYATKGVRINALCPGAVDTPFLEVLPKHAYDQLIFATPMERLAKAEEMAQAVLWLCSDGASYVTGLALPVDGGTALGGVGSKFGWQGEPR